MENQFDPRPTGVNAATVGVPRAARDAGLRSYMLSVYNYMASGVLLTGIVALLFANSSLMGLLFNTTTGQASPLFWVVLFAPLGLVMWLSWGINRMSASTAQTLFFVYAAVMGVQFSSLFLVYTGHVDRSDLLRGRGRLHGPQPLRLYDQEGSERLGFVPDHGRGRPVRRAADQPVPALAGDGPGDQRHRRADLRRPHRLRHAEDQEHVSMRSRTWRGA